MASGLDSETKRNIDASQAQVLDEIKKTGLLQSLTVEYHDNGTIKRIQRNLDIKNVLTGGVITIVSGVTIHYVGSEKIIEVAKAALALAQAAQGVYNVAQGRPVQKQQHNVL